MDDLKKFRINNSSDSPERLDYDIMGLHKKRTILVGELRTIEYYRNFNGSEYSELVVRESRTYTRNELGLVEYRTLLSEWFLNNDEVGTTITNIKYYSPVESVDEGIQRRKNIIADAKIYCLDTLGQSYAFDLLISLKSYIDIYTDGYKQPLLDAVTNSTKPYLTSELKSNIVDLLTF